MNYTLVGDIGGTHPRLAIIDENLKITAKKDLDTSASDIVVQINSFLEEVSKKGITTSRCCLAVAGVVEDQHCDDLTNSNYSKIEKEDILNRTLLKDVFIINDFEAIAHGLLELPSFDEHVINIKEGIVQKGNKAIVGPGTGLGVSYLYESHKKLMISPSQGGHATIGALPGLECLFSYIRKKLSIDVVDAEALVSGEGISNIISYLLNAKKLPESYCTIEKDIVKDDVFIEALNKDEPIAEKVSQYYIYNKKANMAMNIFSGLLGVVAQNIALHGQTTGGIYLGGGIIIKNLYLFENDFFIKSFLDTWKKDIKEFLKEIPVFIIDDYDISLYGCALAIEKESSD